MLFATDGLHEMRNHKEEDLSWGRLGEIWNACLGKSADESLDFLFAEVQAFSGEGRHHDDVTALVLKVPGRSSGVAVRDPAAPGVDRLETGAGLLVRS